MKDKVLKAVKSRTVWVILAMVLVNGVPSIEHLIPASYQPVVNAILGLLATYFKVSPSQSYGTR